MTTMALT